VNWAYGASAGFAIGIAFARAIDWRFGITHDLPWLSVGAPLAWAVLVTSWAVTR
jgi:hypothetical protein